MAADSEIDPEEIDDLVDDIADIVFLENGGVVTDWKWYPFAYYRLFCEWRDAERRIREMRERNLDAFIKGWLKNG